MIRAKARGVIEAYAKAGLTIATAESCTGGLIAAALTDIAGSSAVLERGYVTYSNAAKVEMIGVDAATLAEHGAVSEPVACEMAEGARRASGAGVAISVTGIAGPGGGSAEKPVGLVHFACASPGTTRHRECRFGPLDRADIRSASVGVALDMLLDALADQPAF
ncbi:competence/damage-inducible protein [Aurantimonas manganoxydans SI85-9A1]|uniref:Competence/damage-inducible protein n=1 Tax=Aurantimonas manganoxydans (strain ATCC BAA-1229 / DSM 21871 / SI85-9A1) TaxID=287752 RepID=Q1YI08_AURMS|nr:CinA family protein [Aurantimonas manganoxydans]EAS50309.1 competence/damage-inducible protein [Aurantimonas manganoxydans SI85-9A1]